MAEVIPLVNAGGFVAEMATGQTIAQSRITGLAVLSARIDEIEGATASYVHNQNTPASVWSVTHALGRYPSVAVFDSGGSEVEGDVSHISFNQLTITFSAGFSGVAYLN